MSKQLKGQMNMDVALRTTCAHVPGYPCTYYVGHNLKEAETGIECKVKCCGVCPERRLCGYACNASGVIKRGASNGRK